MPGLSSAVKVLEKRRAGLMDEVEKIDSILETLRSLDSGSVRVARGRRKGGKWKPGRPGRPPKWYTDQMKAKGKAAAKPAKMKGKRKRKVSAKQLAAMAKAREALAAKRAAAK